MIEFVVWGVDFREEVTSMLEAAVTLMVLGLLFGAGLAYAARVLEVKRDERIEAIEKALPGINCGACGHAGCAAFSEALAAGDVEVTACTVSDSRTLTLLAELLGEEVDTTASRRIARIRCRGTEEAAKRFRYSGLQDCAAAHGVAGGHMICEHGCLGMGSCVAVCPVDALYMGDEGLPIVDPERCTGCGACVQACPRDVIAVLPEDQPVLLTCVAPMGPREAVRACSNACLGCGLCERRCPEGAIVMENNLPVIDFERCTGCGVCVGVCPADSLELSSDDQVDEPREEGVE